MAFNDPATPVLLLACARLGAILVPCNPEVSADDAHYIFSHAQVMGVLCSVEALDRVEQALAGVAAPTTVGAELHANGEQPPWITLLDALPIHAGSALATKPATAEGTTAPHAASQAAPPAARRGTADHTLFILYTSGTTSFPRGGVMHSQGSYVLTAEAFV